ncbi:MAG: LytTR family DNA-binding domain-containing protein [Bacteroidota bacterium]
MTKAPAISLSFQPLTRPVVVGAAAAIGLALFYLIGFAIRPDALSLDGLTGWQLVWLLLIDQWALECISIGILFGIVRGYAQWRGLTSVQLAPRALLRYALGFLPVAIVAFAVFNPVTQTLRFLLRHAPPYDTALYLDYFLLNGPLWALYGSLSVVLVGGGLAYVFAVSAAGQTRTAQRSRTSPVITGKREGSLYPIAIADVLWFEVENRVYYAVTAEGRFRLSTTLRALETDLDEGFVRISRSVIVNTAQVERFAPWYDGKYVLYIGTTEHVVSRSRVAALKQSLGIRPAA